MKKSPSKNLAQFSFFLKNDQFIAGVARLFCLRAKFARKMVLRAAKFSSKNFGLVFWFLAIKRPNYRGFFTNLSPKNREVLPKVCYRGRKKNFGGPQFGHAWFIGLTISCFWKIKSLWNLSQMKLSTFNSHYANILYNSGSQPVCRGTLGCPEKV